MKRCMFLPGSLPTKLCRFIATFISFVFFANVHAADLEIVVSGLKVNVTDIPSEWGEVESTTVQNDIYIIYSGDVYDQAGAPTSFEVNVTFTGLDSYEIKEIKGNSFTPPVKSHVENDVTITNAGPNSLSYTIVNGSEQKASGKLIFRALHKGTKKATESISGLSDQADALKILLDQLAADYASKIKVDAAGLKNFITEAAADYGWTAERIAEEVNKVIDEAVKSINAKAPQLVKDIVSSLTTAYTEAVKLFDPKALFQADYLYYNSDYAGNVWSRGGVNLGGEATGIDVTGVGVMGFRAGVAAGLNATVDLKIELKVRGSISIDGFNSVGPISGTGKDIKIIATPKYKTVRGGALGVTAFLGVTVGADITGNGVLDDVSTTLSVP